jgi:hypothetical protein
VLSLLFYHEYKTISIKTEFDRSPQAVAGTNHIDKGDNGENWFIDIPFIFVL